MNSLQNQIANVELLCFETTVETPPDQVETKIQEYMKNYPHLRNPASIDLLRMTVQLWCRIQKAEVELGECTDPKMKLKLGTSLDNMVVKWMKMIGDLGLTFTKQQYIKQKSNTVVSPLERLKTLRPQTQPPQEATE